MAESDPAKGLMLRFPTLEFRSLILNAIGRESFPDRAVWKRHKVELCGLLLTLTEGNRVAYDQALDQLVHRCLDHREGPHQGGRARQRPSRVAPRQLPSSGSLAPSPACSLAPSPTSSLDSSPTSSYDPDAEQTSAVPLGWLAAVGTPAKVSDGCDPGGRRPSPSPSSCSAVSGSQSSSTSPTSPSSSSLQSSSVPRGIPITSAATDTAGVPAGADRASRTPSGSPSSWPTCTSSGEEGGGLSAATRPCTPQQEHQQQLEPSSDEAALAEDRGRHRRPLQLQRAALRAKVDEWCRAVAGVPADRPSASSPSSSSGGDTRAHGVGLPEPPSTPLAGAAPAAGWADPWDGPPVTGAPLSCPLPSASAPGSGPSNPVSRPTPLATPAEEEAPASPHGVPHRGSPPASAPPTTANPCPRTGAKTRRAAAAAGDPDAAGGIPGTVRSRVAASAAAFAWLRPLLVRVMALGEPAPLVDIKRNGSHTELQVASLMSGQLPPGWQLLSQATFLRVDGAAFPARKRLKGEADLLLVDQEGVVQAVVEVKTAKGNPIVALYEDVHKLMGLLRVVRNRTVTFRHGAGSPQRTATLAFSKRLRPIYVLGCGSAGLGLDSLSGPAPASTASPPSGPTAPASPPPHPATSLAAAPPRPSPHTTPDPAPTSTSPAAATPSLSRTTATSTTTTTITAAVLSPDVGSSDTALYPPPASPSPSLAPLLVCPASSVLRAAWAKVLTMELGRELSAASKTTWAAVSVAQLTREAAVLRVRGEACEILTGRVGAYFTRLGHCGVFLVDTAAQQPQQHEEC